MLLLCSFDPKDIDLARTNSVGLRHLRAYLEPAAGGFDQLAEADTREADRGARILTEVAEGLRGPEPHCRHEPRAFPVHR